MFLSIFGIEIPFNKMIVEWLLLPLLKCSYLEKLEVVKPMLVFLVWVCWSEKGSLIHKIYKSGRQSIMEKIALGGIIGNNEIQLES